MYFTTNLTITMTHSHPDIQEAIAVSDMTKLSQNRYSRLGLKTFDIIITFCVLMFSLFKHHRWCL